VAKHEKSAKREQPHLLAHLSLNFVRVACNEHSILRIQLEHVVAELKTRGGARAEEQKQASVPSSR
jgi:hypothetical protein